MTRMTRTLALAGCLLAAACGDDDPASPTREEVAGTYEATTLTITQAGVAVDLLDEGAFVDLELTATGEAFGHIFVPEGGEGGGDFDESLDGVYRISGQQVLLDVSGDVFLNDVGLRVSGDQLIARYDADGSRIDLTLERVDPVP